MHEHVIHIEGLYKSFRQLPVLQGIDLKIKRGTVFCLLGSNGAGKTTMVKILATLLPYDKGRVRVCDYDVKESPRRVRSHISLTGQYAAVDELLTGRENMYMVGRLFHAGGYKKRAAGLLEQFDLTDAANRRSGSYSGGMRRKLDIAMSLMGSPDVLFLDEPTTGLDPQTRLAMWQEIHKLKQMGTTVFLTTQYLEEAEQLADHVAILHEGRIKAEGTVAQLKGLLPGGSVVLTFEKTHYDAAERVLKNYTYIKNDAEYSYVVLTDGDTKTLTSILLSFHDSGIPPKDISLRQPSLEDVFLSQIHAKKESKTA